MLTNGTEKNGNGNGDIEANGNENIFLGKNNVVEIRNSYEQNE